MRNTNCKLTEVQVIEIRNSDLNPAQLSEKYGVCVGTIGKVIIGQTWKHLPGARPAIKPHQRNAKLTEGNVLAIRKSESKQYQLATIYNVTPATISHIIRGNTWTHIGVLKRSVNKLTEEDVRFIRRASHLTLSQLATQYSVGIQTIWKALHGVTFTKLLGAKPIREKAEKQSGFKNVIWIKSQEYWLAQFTLKGEIYYCGTYDFPGEANEAVLKKRAALKLKGIE